MIDHETLNFGKEINDAGYYIVYSWESEISIERTGYTRTLKKGAISMKIYVLWVAHCTVCSILVLHFVYGKLQEDNLRYICFADGKYEIDTSAESYGDGIPGFCGKHDLTTYSAYDAGLGKEAQQLH